MVARCLRPGDLDANPNDYLPSLGPCIPVGSGTEGWRNRDMKLYRLTRTDTGATLIVCAKSPVAARKVAMKHGEAWASATITKIQHFKPSGSTERVVLGPLVETQEESDEPDEEPDAPEISTMQAVEKLASVAADWLIVNADTVRLLVQRVRGA